MGHAEGQIAVRPKYLEIKEVRHHARDMCGTKALHSIPAEPSFQVKTIALR
jgi:hypothetical protein